MVLIGINLLYFIIRQKQQKEEGKEKDRKRMLILIIASILLMITVIFLAKDVIAFKEEEIEAMIQQLKSQNKDNPESENYLVTDKIISRVKPKTTIKMLKSNVENVEVIDGEDLENVKTGMVAKYGKNGRTYEISVLGDINADGILNQIDLTRTIREYRKSEKWKIKKEVEKIAADVTFDGEINEKDIHTIINYILYGELQVKQVSPVISPKVEVISGIEAEKGRYLSNVTVKVTQENKETQTAKTIYEVTGSKTIEEKEINNKQEEIKLTEAGIYKITSYTYGVDGNKSKGSEIIVVIDTPEIKTNTEDWTNENVTVTIEGKDGYEIEYKIDDGEWKKYEEGLEIEENCEITTRFKKDDIYGEEIKKEITNIDKEKPTGKIEVTSSGSGKLALAVEGQDARLSGIKEIRVYVKEKTSPQYECKTTYNYEEDPNKNDLKQESFIWKGLDAATAYDIYIEVEDRAGNIYNKNNTERDENTTITTTTKEMPTAVIVATPVGWTRGNVEVSIESDEEYEMEYKINNGDWRPYTDKLKIADNCTIVARLTECESIQNVSEVTKEISNIDKLAPNDFTPMVSSKTNCITMTGSTTDQDETQTDGNSGIEKYYFSKDNGKTWEPTEGQEETTYVFENLTQGTAYNLKMKAVDKAGNETTADVITKETITVPDLTDGNTTITYSTTEPTNKDVTVTIMTTAGSDYTIQYSKDHINWYDYETAVSMSQNGDIYARVRDSTGQIGGNIKGNVSNIDKLPPNLFTATVAGSTTCDITITGSTTDQARTEAYASSGIAKYYFSKDDGETWEPVGGQTETNYTFRGLIQNTAYPLKMKAVDKAGNETITTNSVTQKTGTLPDLTDGNTTFSYSTTNLTNQNVMVMITTTETIGTLQYSKDGTNWTDYTVPVCMTQNGPIYARLWDGTNVGGATQGKVENIDKLPPNSFTPTATSTQNSITVTAYATDPKDANGYSGSGIAGYSFSIDNGATWTNWQPSGQYTFGNLTPGSYTILVKAKDKVGHETQGSVTQQIVTLSLSSTSGKVLSGNSITVTVNGANYGTLSCSSANGSIATASLSGNVLTVRGTSTANGTQSTTITVRGSNGGSATYTIQCHKHYGSSTSGGGCYGQSHTGTRDCGITFNLVSRTCGNDLIKKNCQGRFRYRSQGTPYESDQYMGRECGLFLRYLWFWFDKNTTP